MAMVLDGNTLIPITALVGVIGIAIAVGRKWQTLVAIETRLNELEHKVERYHNESVSSAEGRQEKLRIRIESLLEHLDRRRK
jgi:hypothetical protein